MARATVAASSLEFRIRRPVPMSIELDRTASRKPLGVGLDYITGGGSLLVTDISDGLVSDWNKKNPPENQVTLGARIVGVNGFMGDSESLLAMCKTETTIELKIVSPLR